ncbi:MAG: helicase-exonuclease AddAB subunit AddB [Butyrivibrio sp.]|nr:helicase-exonuclease AddAB subunit AddB [Butyrivibrio sp.]
MLRFIYGASGAGKSRTVYDEIIKRSMEEDRNFLIVVPDQFTMQTQMDIVKLHPRHGIMNIDVLSFSRLSHRIFEEVGEENTKVLNDMGKSLVLRHVAEKMKDELPVIGSNMHKMGYIDEVKSSISEFMQYCIEPKDMDVLVDAAKDKGALCAKLKDLQKLYKGFKDYISGEFIAQEETMEVLCRALYKSALIPGSVIVFDGFTGFTPIQYQVIKVLMSLAKEVIFTCTIGQDDNPYEYDKDAEQELFLLSKKTVHDLLRLEYENIKEMSSDNIPTFEAWSEYRNAHSEDMFVKNTGKSRHAANEELGFLEKRLFRYGKETFDAETENIVFMEANDTISEMRMVFAKICELVREKGLYYRDFAIVCGSLERYAAIAEAEAKNYNVPIYIDQTGSVGLNPFIEYVRGGLSVVNTNYSFESVFHFLRSYMSDITQDEADEIENYVRALGIRGKKAWENEFSKVPPKIKKRLYKFDDPEAEKKNYLDSVNAIREKIVLSLKPLFDAKDKSVKDFSLGLYEFISNADAENKLKAYEERFHQEGDEVRAKEYGVIYRKLMELIDEITSLMGDENLSLQEYTDILEVGINDISIGTIPQSADRIVVGDIERTRLKEIKVLFFLGVNDDLIPKGTGTGGILSDIERQMLIESVKDVEMAPTPRQQMYIQRLYLYMNLTKPSDSLYISWAHLDPAGKSIRPAYLVGKIASYFSDVKTLNFDKLAPTELLQTKDAGTAFIAENMQQYTLGYLSEEKQKTVKALYRALIDQEDKDRLLQITEAAGKNYMHKPLSEAVTDMLYGNVLINSVSRLEKFAQCSYAHFLRYGLGLDERDEYVFDVSDLGNVFHGVLKTFSDNLEKEKLKWTTFSKEDGVRILDESIDAFLEEYGSDVLSSSSRGLSTKSRIRRILQRSVDTLQYQLQKGSFMPKSMEVAFNKVGDIDAINVNLLEDEKGRILKNMKLTGRIDRIDTYEDADHVYVKVIDFKSGDKKFDLCALYYGLQLQLVMYMNVAKGMEKATNPKKEIVPAAILYYHLADPVLEGDSDTAKATNTEINEMIRKQLRPKGLIARDGNVVNALDHNIGQESDVIRVKLNNDGSFSKRGSEVMGADDFAEVSKYVERLIQRNGREIVSGNVEVNPYEMGDRSACDYCSFKSVCNFDRSIPGYKKRELEKLSDDDVVDLIIKDGKK